MDKIDNNTPRPATGSPGAGPAATPDAPATGETPPAKPRRPRGFAAMDRKLVTELARKGGKAAHQLGAAHEFSSDEAREAGRKGGLASHLKRRARDAQQPQNPPKSGES